MGLWFWKWDDSKTGDNFETGYNVGEPSKTEKFVEQNMSIGLTLN